MMNLKLVAQSFYKTMKYEIKLIENKIIQALFKIR